MDLLSISNNKPPREGTMQNYERNIIAPALMALTAGASALVSAQALEGTILVDMPVAVFHSTASGLPVGSMFMAAPGAVLCHLLVLT